MSSPLWVNLFQCKWIPLTNQELIFFRNPSVYLQFISSLPLSVAWRHGDMEHVCIYNIRCQTDLAWYRNCKISPPTKRHIHRARQLLVLSNISVTESLKQHFFQPFDTLPARSCDTGHDIYFLISGHSQIFFIDVSFQRRRGRHLPTSSKSIYVRYENNHLTKWIFGN